MKSKTNTRTVTILAFAAFVLVCIIGCDSQTSYVPPSPVSKKIIAKEAPVEQRMGIDLFADRPLRQKSVTIHYLVAEDGSVVEVGLSDYAATEIGSNYSSTAWARK
jgi:hypothetical protein